MVSQSAAIDPGARVSVVLSFKNEADSLDELVDRLRAVLDSERADGLLASYELVFVNDASTDRSLEILRRHRRQADDIRIINMSRTFGVTPCVLAGLQYATGDAMVYMDADLQDPPEVIHDMLKAWREGEDIEVVNTVRLSRSGETRVKLFATRVGYYILQKATDISIIPNAGDFKLLSRKAVDHLVRFNEKKPFMRGLVHWIGFRQATVHYHRGPRAGGKTKFPVFGAKVMRNFFQSALISFSDVPLHLVSLLGLLVSLGSFLYSIYIVVEKFRGHNLPGWSAIMVTMLFLGGVQLISLGIIGLYINTIYQETKGRPNFIVESTMGFSDGPEPERTAPDRPAGSIRPAS